MPLATSGIRFALGAGPSAMALIEGRTGRPDARGAVRKHAMRQVINASPYQNKTGCQRRLLPRDFPPWFTVYNRFWRMRDRGVWEKIVLDLNARRRKKTAMSPRPRHAHHRLANGQNQLRGRGRGIPRRQKNQRPQPPDRRRQPGTDPGGAGACGEPARHQGGLRPGRRGDGPAAGRKVMERRCRLSRPLCRAPANPPATARAHQPAHRRWLCRAPPGAGSSNAPLLGSMASAASAKIMTKPPRAPKPCS